MGMVVVSGGERERDLHSAVDCDGWMVCVRERMG